METDGDSSEETNKELVEETNNGVYDENRKEEFVVEDVNESFNGDDIIQIIGEHNLSLNFLKLEILSIKLKDSVEIKECRLTFIELL